MKTDEFHASFILRQHTPMIHFQHGQEGATLRMSDLKPRLDRFLLQHPNFLEQADWLIDHPDPAVKALNYQVRLLPVEVQILPFNRELPGFFGNMKKSDEEKKRYVMSETGTVSVRFFFPDKSLKEKVTPLLPEFFSWSNFGTRQTKGFGCFYPDGQMPLLDYYFTLRGIREDEFMRVFHHIDLFYRSLRGGINLKGHNGEDLFYFKSLLFKYVTDAVQNEWQQPFQWEKKTIKERVLSEYLTKQFNRRTKNGQYKTLFTEPLWFSAPEKRLVKDLLGLASDEAWKAEYNISLRKKPINEPRIERFASPILFKPIWNDTEKNWRIYFGVKANPYQFDGYEPIQFLGQKFRINATGSNANGNVDEIRLPDQFNVDKFLRYVFNPTYFQIDSYVDDLSKRHDEYFGILKDIYSQLQKKYGNG